MDSKKIIILLEILFFFLLLLVFGGPYGSPFRGDINFIDEGQFGAWAYQMMEGKKLYGDIYTTYGPLYTFPLYFFFRLFGTDVFIVRAYLLAGTLLGGIICLTYLHVFRVKVWIRWIGLIILATMPILSLRQSIGLLTILILFFSVENQSNKLGLLAGLFLVVTILISPEIAVFTFLTCLIYLFIRLCSAKYTSQEIPRIINFFSGIGIGSAVFFLWAASGKWLSSYILVTADVFMSFSGVNVPNGQNFPPLNSILVSGSIPDLVRSLLSREALLYWELLFLIGCIQFFVITFLMTRFKRSYVLPMLLSFFGLQLYTILLSRHGLGHFYFTLSPLVLVSAFIVDLLVQRISQFSRKDIIFISVLLFVISIFYVRLFMIQRYVLGNQILSFFSDSYVRVDNKSLLSISNSQNNTIETVRSLIDQYTDEKDLVFFLSDQPMMYLLSNRINPTRYDLPFVANTIQKRFEVLYNLKNSNNTVIIDKNVWSVDGISNTQRLPEIMQLLRDDYVLKEEVNGILLYQKKKVISQFSEREEE